MRIVIVGCGKVGTTLAEQLNREKHEIVLIEKNPEVLQGVTNTLDLIGVAGNGASSGKRGPPRRICSSPSPPRTS